MRTSNAVDFWRGLALIMIFIDHVPGSVFAGFTLQNVAICDAAELFVFLAGCSLSVATGGPRQPDPPSRVVFRLLSRAIELYRAQLVLTLLALALLAMAALLLSNPLYVEWNNAGSIFYDPMRGLVGVVLLTHQLHFVDILPLYIVLLLFAVPMFLLGRLHLPSALVVSGGIYLWAIVWRANLPSWPNEGGWFFNPLSWQFVLMLGFACGELNQAGDRLQRATEILAPPSAVAVILLAAVSLARMSPDPILVPEPRLLFLFDKTYVSPVRILNLLALVLAFAHVHSWLLKPRLGPVDRWLCSMGRNSLAVFGIGCLLSLFGQFAHFLSDGSVWIDTLVLGFGLLGMNFTCWFVEWRERSGTSRGSSQQAAASQP
ncbi:MAG: OpgC family protein [Hyphomicrobiaceae bacterium]